MTEQPGIFFDLSTAGGRSHADQFLASLNENLDGIVEVTVAEIGMQRTNNVDGTQIALGLVERMQTQVNPAVSRLAGLCLYRLAIQYLEGPQTWTFSARSLPTRECEIRLTLPPGRVDDNTPQWVQMRAIANEILAKAAADEAAAKPPPPRHPPQRVLGYCADCQGPITALTGFQFGERGATHINCPGKGFQR